MSATAPQRTYTPADGARFKVVFAHTQNLEGGYVDNASDHGGPTNWGISLRFLQAQAAQEGLAGFDLNHDGDIDGADIRLLTPDDAEALLERCIWLRTGFWALPQPFDAVLFDEGVNAGVAAAVKLLQQGLNSMFRTSFGLAQLVVDGVLGDKTRARLQLAIVTDRAIALQSYRDAAEARYRLIALRDPTQLQFLAGWLNRAAVLGNV